ncbi:MAG TPA: site-2 protease family protein [Ruminococcaceae bacterium]|nr:site-2 protease family protein [Oscillospiraceae bacterium]
MLYYMINNWDSLDLIGLILVFFAYAMVILVALPIHEFSHAYVADRMGDQTARWNGRLTLNPFAHLDVIGTALIFLIGFGYAKPVPVNPRNFRDYKKGTILTSFAGPLSNFILGFLSLLIFRLILFASSSDMFYYFLSLFIVNFAYTNIILAVFNLMPVPPLDGYRIASSFLPPRWVFFIERYQWYITIAFFVLVVSDRFGGVLTRIANPIYNLFFRILGL